MSDSHKPKLQLRKYQKDIVDAIGNENAIIKMPTGSGKTFIAAEFIKRHRCEGSRRAALFLVPACDLVGQQKRALKDWIGECDVAEYMGGATCPGRSFDVLVSTPQAFLVSKTKLIIVEKVYYVIIIMHLPLTHSREPSFLRRCSKLRLLYSVGPIFGCVSLTKCTTY